MMGIAIPWFMALNVAHMNDEDWVKNTKYIQHVMERRTYLLKTAS